MLKNLLGDKKKEDTGMQYLGDDFASMIATLHGRTPSNDDKLQLAGGRNVSEVLPVSTALASKPPEPEKPKHDPSKLNIGDKVYNDAGVCTGVYVGTEERVDKDGLKQVWDLYAAPEDLTDENDNTLVTTYNNAVAGLNQKKAWHGHDGECFRNDTELKQAFANGTYQGGWFIPTKEVLHGQDTDNNKVQDHNLYDHKDKMPDGSKFVTVGNGSGNARWYWSATETPHDRSNVFGVNFMGGGDDWSGKDKLRLSSRPVRAEPRSS